MIDRVLQVFLDILHFVKFLNFYGHKGGLKKMFALKDKKIASKIEWIQKVFGVRVHVSVAVAAIYYLLRLVAGNHKIARSREKRRDG